MSDVMETAGQPAAEEKPSRGCLYGCLAVGVLILGTFICGGFAVYFFIAGQVEKYTAATATELPAVEYTEEQLESLHARIDTFKEAVEGDEQAEDLVLTAEEINALINEEEKMRGRAHVDIKDDVVIGDISIPTDSLPGGKGRFFNASATFDVSLERGVLIVTLNSAEVKGEPVPEEFMEAMRKENLAKDVYKDPENAKVLSRFESIEIVDDKIILRLKREEESSDTDDSSEDADASENEGEASADDSGASDESGDGTASEGSGESGEESAAEETGSEASGEDASGEDASGEDASGEDASGEDASGEDASGEDASGEDASGEDASGEDASGEDASGEDASGEDASGEDASGEDASGEDASGEETEAVEASAAGV